LIKIFGGKSLVFIDESGFEPSPVCVYALEEKSKKSLWGENRKKRYADRAVTVASPRLGYLTILT
jgi:hypothetical protein